MSSAVTHSLIVPIVEGQGDLEAASSLIRRILNERLNEYGIQVGRAKRLSKGKALTELTRFLKYASYEQGCRAAIVLIDADERCAKKLAMELAQQAGGGGTTIGVAIVCPKAEFETWFIASIEEIRGQPIGDRGAVINAGAECPPDVEELRGAKEWLSHHMPKDMTYKTQQDQARLTHYINFVSARSRSRSFRRMCHAVEEIVVDIRSGVVRVTPQ